MTIDPRKIMRDPVKDGPYTLAFEDINERLGTRSPPTASDIVLQRLDQKPEKLYIDPRTTFPLLKLPNELLQTIFRIVRGDGMCGLTGTKSDGYQDIKSLLFTSKAVYQLSVLHLYRRITAREGQFASLTRTLIENPRLAQETRELAVYFDHQFIPKSKHVRMHPTILEGVPVPRNWKDKAGMDAINKLFMRRLSALLLRQMCRLEVLDIIGVSDRLFENSDPPLLLPNLRELSLPGGSRHFYPYFDEQRAEFLSRVAPNLETLRLPRATTNAAGLTHAPRTLKSISIDLDSWLPVGATLFQQMPVNYSISGAALGFTTCTISADPSKADRPYWVPHIQNILSYCPRVESLTLLLEWEFRCMPCPRTPRDQRRFPVITYKRLEDALDPCRATLRSLRVTERAPTELIHLTAESLSEFVKLEDLEISSGIVTRVGDIHRLERKKGGMKFFLEHLPPSLRCLKLRKQDEEVDSELAMFIEGIGPDRFPSFKTMKVRSIHHDWSCSARLKAACRQKGIEFSYGYLR